MHPRDGSWLGLAVLALVTRGTQRPRHRDWQRSTLEPPGLCSLPTLPLCPTQAPRPPPGPRVTCQGRPSLPQDSSGPEVWFPARCPTALGSRGSPRTKEAALHTLHCPLTLPGHPHV